MTRHLFRTIDSLLRPNDNNDKDRLDAISIKKLKKGDASWSTTKTVLGWAINMAKQVLTHPPARKEKLDKALGAIPRDSHRCSKKKWQCLLVILQSTVPAIAGAHGMFSRLQHTLRVAAG